MTTGLYGTAKLQMAKGGTIDWVADTIKAVPIISPYVPDFSAHVYLSDVPAGARPATPVALTGKTRTLTGASLVYSADGPTFTTGVAPANGPILGILLFKDTGVAGTSYLIGYFDNLSNLPLTTNSHNVVIAWPSTGNKVFAQ